MDAISVNPYPGATASVWEITELAEAYYDAALALFKNAEKLGPRSHASFNYAPARLCAIHAIELFLNAFLRHEGIPPEQIRGRMHNLADPVFVATLKLKKKTAQHLQDIGDRREYLIARYAPEQVTQHTELNRLTATLAEIMTKCGTHIRLNEAVRSK